MRLTIIGGGPGGHTAAFAAAKQGMEVCLVESQSIGGVCLNHGCIPTKTLRASADCALQVKRMAEFGIDGIENATVNMATIAKRKNAVRDILRTGLLKTCQNLKIRLINGRGRLLDSTHVHVTTKDGEEVLTTDRVILATGSVHMPVPECPVDHTAILDSNDALDLTHLPKSMWVLGGGVIGCEMACIFKALGCDVTLVQRRPTLLASAHVDSDISTLIHRELRKQKITVLTERTLEQVRVEDGLVHGQVVASKYAKAPVQAKEFATESLLVTVGRLPNTANLGLKEAGVAVDEKGWIKVNDCLETSLAGVYAIGDVLGPKHVMLAHVAAAEGLCALENIMGHKTPMGYDVVPAAIFTSPEVGYVGLSQEEASKQGEIVAETFQMRELGKSQAQGDLPGFLKVVADAKTGRLLGAHMVGAHTTDMIAEAALAIKLKATVQDIAHTIHAHPTLSEGFYEAARLAYDDLR
ncbi:MAG: dihydrolipoyl dehydrogenase [Desulfovibrionaceae bacterium]|nr:dihydrolipoyl dehydrogenase [Desulfovibrionaceae bacterium]